jgi:LacI family transcriptional regulator
MHDAGLTPHDHLITRTASGEQAGGRLAARRMFSHAADSRPTAVVCFNDRMALGVFQAAAAARVKVPRDLSIVGFDDIEFVSDNLGPGLTTMRHPFEDMAAAAVPVVVGEASADRFGEGLPYRLIRRGSLAPPRS